MQPTDTEGKITYSIIAKDAAGNAAPPITDGTAGATVATGQLQQAHVLRARVRIAPSACCVADESALNKNTGKEGVKEAVRARMLRSSQQ